MKDMTDHTHLVRVNDLHTSAVTLVHPLQGAIRHSSVEVRGNQPFKLSASRARNKVPRATVELGTENEWQPWPVVRDSMR